ncbi:EAL domain-containing response regulator [Rhodoferax sp.]|uniref:EAL domain-containing response regulator n=3 Tax=Rhodoferax sp. TaxID=50421 RepID=UPI00262E09E2|nr:EAL domain-containing response regulator [Rhodoferax sp.]MDD2808110.1 EAL domain-containing response regulator [Rhodoferax sp.]
MTATDLTILVVDDDEFQRDLMVIQLANLGWHNVLLADSGAQALALFEQHRTHIGAIISDLSMPDMDGLVLMRHLVERHYQAPLILLSGVHDEILSSAAMLANAHGLLILGVLRKPCSPERLAGVMTQLAQRAKPAQSKPAQDKLTALQISAALKAGDIVPWYQPKVDILTGQAVGLEALARWPQPGGDMINPDQFVPVIEAAGLSEALLLVMVTQILADMVVWRSQGLSPCVAVNLSMENAYNLELPERLGELVAQAGLQPSDLVLEVTESRLMIDRSLAMETLTRLSLMGFVLSIDDFGTGFSSLVQLIDLPFHELKIDGSFVQRADTERKARAVVQIAVLLGRQLGMKVIAEGVETPAQLDFVRASGGQIVQGFLYARPMSFEACSQWLHAHAPV